MTKLELMELGSPGPLRDRLVEEVVRGEKTATSSLLVQFEQAGEPLPEPGTKKVLVDSQEKAIGQIEIVRALDPYSLGIPGVYICSAATPPGAGAHGMCGYNAALSALRHLNPATAGQGAAGPGVASAPLTPAGR